jgi:hypothetical protein
MTKDNPACGDPFDENAKAAVDKVDIEDDRVCMVWICLFQFFIDY